MNKLQDIETYFSDDEEKNAEEQEEYEEESDDSLDEHTKRILYETAIRNLDQSKEELEEMEKGFKTKTPTLKKQPKNKKSPNVLSLGEFTKKVEQEVEAKKPKKFVSKRVQEKKKLDGQENEPKRQFNPRLPPYNFVHRAREKQSSVNLQNEKQFPTL